MSPRRGTRQGGREPKFTFTDCPVKMSRVNATAPRIRRIPAEAISEVGLVAVPNTTSQARYFVDVDGRRWVGKHALDMGHEAVLAEAIGWMVCMEIDAPIPDACVAGAGTELVWLSECVSPVVHWTSDAAPRLQNPQDLGRALAADCLLLNGDRHVGNILLEPSPKRDTFKSWAIDFDHALVGWPADFAEQPDTLPSTKALARGLPISLMRKGAREAAREISLWNGGYLAECVDEACELSTIPDTGILAPALAARASMLVGLTDKYLRLVEELS